MNPGNFFAELKRRNVYKVAVAYIIASWALAQGLAQVLPVFDIPNWTVRLLIVLLILGFPVALILAWAFEITPEGIKRTEEVDPNESIRDHTGRKIIALTVALVAVSVAVALFRLPRSTIGLEGSNVEKAGDIPAQSIAVLPLVNTSDDPRNDYFADGLSEELIAVLAKLPALRVIGRSSSFLFKGSSEDSRMIGTKLGVANLLEGTVRKQGDRARIVAELINAADGRALWSNTYDREVKDILAVQSEIAQAVGAQLKITLLGEKPISDSARSSPNPAAHDALLQSRFYFNQGNTDGLRKAINYAEEATRLDPSYAEAWARLSIAMRNYGVSDAGDESEQALAAARVAAAKAYALDPQSIDALMAMQGARSI